LPEKNGLPISSPEVAVDALPYDTRAGIVIGAHGVQGTLKVKPITATSSRLFSPDALNKKEITVWLGPNQSEGKLVRVVSSKRQEPRGLYLVHLKDVLDRTSAENLVGLSLYGQSAQRAELTDDEYFVEDLIGMSIVDLTGQSLGHLLTVHSGVANDVYETDTGVLVPAVKAFIESVDLRTRTITVSDAMALKIE
jgi:16S rRNA processing protein RimM